jgi:hypothetical protein
LQPGATAGSAFVLFDNDDNSKATNGSTSMIANYDAPGDSVVTIVMNANDDDNEAFVPPSPWFGNKDSKDCWAC